MLGNWMSLEAAIALANVALFGFLYLLKQAYNDLRSQVREHREELKAIKEQYIRKDDFNLFKVELWARIDRMEKYWMEHLNLIRKENK